MDMNKRQNERLIIIFSSALVVTVVVMLMIAYSYGVPEYYIHNLIKITLAITIGGIGLFLPGVIGVKWNKVGWLVRLLTASIIVISVYFFTYNRYPSLYIEIMDDNIIMFESSFRGFQGDINTVIKNGYVTIGYRMKYKALKNMPNNALISAQTEEAMLVLDNEELAKARNKAQFVNIDTKIDSGESLSNEYIFPGQIVERNVLFVIDSPYTWENYINYIINTNQDSIKVRFFSEVNNTIVEGECSFSSSDAKSYIEEVHTKSKRYIQRFGVKCL